MKIIRSFLFTTLLLYVYSTSQGGETTNDTASKKIDVGIHTTVETFMIIRALCDDDPILSYRKADFKGRPILYMARNFFSAFKNHPSVEMTRELLSRTSSTGDVIFQGLLYAEELPSTEIIYPLTSPHWTGKSTELQNYLESLKSFYIEANVAAFLEQNTFFYEGAMKEARSYLDERLIPAMENYFGKENSAYSLILIPASPFGMGFGANVTKDGKNHLYQILSPASDVEWNDQIDNFESFGYSGEDASEYFRDMVAHEFCHSFITTVIEGENLKAKINETDSLYIPLLDSVMSEQGYQSWWGFVNEHLVRLGEIRIAESMGNPEINEMRKYNVEESQFVLIPDAEKLVGKYENNRVKYPSFDAFIPVLIDQLEQYSRADMENLLKENLQSGFHQTQE